MTDSEMYTGLSPIEQLNLYRNKYYADGNATEKGIIANAINDFCADNEKQIPKKPLHLHKNFYCPVCKEDGWVLWDDAQPNDFDNYCCRCGQALDWNDITGKE